jgi:hypothetical protein
MNVVAVHLRAAAACVPDDQSGRTPRPLVTLDRIWKRARKVIGQSDLHYDDYADIGTSTTFSTASARLSMEAAALTKARRLTSSGQGREDSESFT